MGKGKKASRKRDDDDWENDLEEIAKEQGIELHNEDAYEAPAIAKKDKKKKNKKESLAENNDDIMDQDAIVNHKPKASFQALMMEDDNDNASDHESEDEIVEEKIEKPTKQTTKKGKDKKKAKTVAADDEDIDAICAEFELNNVESTKGKKSKKKNKKNENDIDTLANEIENIAIEDDNNEVIEKADDAETEIVTDRSKVATKPTEDDEEGPKMKTAAQKKAEKKERENKKKEARRLQKQKEKEKQANEEPKESENEKKDAESTVKGDDTASEVVDITEGDAIEKQDDGDAAGSGSEGEGGEGTQTKDKKKKKKKKKKEEEDTKKKGKKVNKAAIKQMQEALEKVKQEEERLRLEEEAKAKAFEEAEDQRLEKLRLEQEKKDRKKQKDKEKKERLRKEGKLLTPAQKEQKRRAEMMLEAMRQQGIQVPNRDDTGEQKKVKYVTRKPNKKQQQQQQSEQSQEASNAKIDTEPDTNDAKNETPAIAVVEKEPVEEEEEEDLPDSWDLDSEDEEETSAKDKGKETVKPDASGATQVKAASTLKTDAVSAVKDEGATEENAEESSSDESDSGSSSESESETEDDSDSSDSEDENDSKTKADKPKETVRERIIKRHVAAERNRTQDKLRAPVICVLGHVDTGKTKILDKIRHTNVQDGEAGGITQQIGATMVPIDAVKVQTKMVKEFQTFDLRLPGLLIIDTPGHESFSNLRSRGSNLCDMAILVVDIMHGLEPQTIESINLLRKKHTPFVVALNKVDRLFEWKRSAATQFEDTLRKQKKNTKLEFEERTQIVINELAEQGLNSALFFKNTNEKSYISLVPTSAHSGDGMGDLIAMICKLTQTRLAEKLAYSASLESTIMEVKALPGLGTTIDVILVNGKLKEGDTIVTGGIEGPIVTQIRSVLTPQPMRELRVKSQYIQHKEIEAAQGVKLCAKDLERAIAGSPLFVAQQPDEIDYFKQEVAEIIKQSLNAIKVSERGVYVQASTLGSLEALLEFLKTSKIPYCGVNIGPVHKRDIMRASVMLEHNPMYAVILAFDVKVEKDAQDIADKEGVKVFTADIIYHLFDKFTAFTEEYKRKKREEFKHIAIFPCKLRVLPQHIYNSRDPIVIGVNVEAGCVRLGTTLTVPSKEFCDIGIVTGIEGNHKQLEKAMTGQEVSIKIEPTGEAPRMYGRHFTHEDMIMSKISREAIDALKNYFREEMTKQDWQLLIELKKIFEIM